jgi:threonine synthase
MDVGAPSNFDRILDLYNHSHKSITKDITAFRYTDEEIMRAINEVHQKTGYLPDPHGACAYLALKEGLRPGETGIFLATAHPAKFKETVETCIGSPLQIPDGLAAFLQRKKQSHRMANDYNLFKKALINLS